MELLQTQHCIDGQKQLNFSKWLKTAKEYNNIIIISGNGRSASEGQNSPHSTNSNKKKGK